jgi:hypothetical protein
LTAQRALKERAKRRALQVDDDDVAADFLYEARKAKANIQDLERLLLAEPEPFEQVAYW